MHVPRYWSRAEHAFDPEGHHRVKVWRWSDESQASADEAARVRLAQLVEAIVRGERPGRGDYANRPVREERLATYPEGAAEPFAILTRNASGAEVLNAARVPFVDVDLAHVRGPGLLARLRRLFTRAPVETTEERAVARVRAWFDRNPGARGRLYRTRSGLRLLLLDRLLDPAGAEAQALLRELGADPLYRRLCRIQGSFRARLTPKRHRVGMGPIPGEWPAGDPAMAAARERWIEEYRARCRGHATCRVVADLGSGPVHPEAARVRELHDRATLAFGDVPLA
jgi:hypothetical protein